MQGAIQVLCFTFCPVNPVYQTPQAGASNVKRPGVPDIIKRTKTSIFLQQEVVSDLGSNVLKANSGAGNATEPYTVERKPWQSANFHLPLYASFRGMFIAVPAHEHVLLDCLVTAVVFCQNSADLLYDCIRLQCTRRFHAPRETETPWLVNRGRL